MEYNSTTMKETVSCPCCKGTKTCPTQKSWNDVFGKTEVETCWMCKGEGQVEQEPSAKLHILKYWSIQRGTAGGELAGK